MVQTAYNPLSAVGQGIGWGFATGGGIGFFPLFPGTLASLLALGIFVAVPYPGDAVYLAVVLLLFLFGIPLTTWAEKKSGRTDDPRIVWDEMVGMWVALYALPAFWSLPFIAFVLFRIFDIWKPFGESGERGFGMMLDDLLAGVCANISIQIAHQLADAFI